MTFQKLGCASCLLFLVLTLRPAEAGTAEGEASSVEAQKERKDSLLVYGEGWAFTVKEPPGWRGDVEAAQEHGANIIFFPKAAEPKSSNVTIRVRVNQKVDENTAADLEADREAYKQEYPQVQFHELHVRHPQYETFPGLFFKPGSFYEYVSYVNPGPKHRMILSVAMSKEKAAATKSELEAYEAVLRSVTVVSPGSGGNPKPFF